LVVTTESVAYLWKLGDFLHPLRTGVINKVEGAGWSPDGTRAFTCATGGMVRTWSCDGEQLNQGDGPDHIAISVANPTKPWFAVCGEFGNLMVMTYDCRSIGSLGNRRLRGEPLAFSSDGNLLAAATWPGEILVLRVWDPALPLFVTGDRTMCGAWSHAGRTIVTGGGWTVGPPPRIGGGVKTWDVTTGLLLDEIDLGLQVIGLFPDPSGERLIATQGRNNRGAAVILQRGPDTWKQVRALPHSTLNPYAWHAQFASDDQVLLVDHGGRILQWELTTNNVSQRLPATDNPGGADSIYHRWLAIATTPDRSMVWAGGTPGYLHRFDRVVDDTYVEATPIRVGPIRVLCTLPDGSLLVGGFGGLLQRRCTDGTVSRFAGHRGDVLAVDWATLDGEILVASVDRGGFVRLWRADGTLVREVRQLDSGVCSVRFSPDGTRLLTTNELGAARIWPVRTADLLALARKRVSR
jgi:WD40 repeat protein